MTAVASTEQIRAAFPALQRMQAGQPVAYFDGPGGTQVPQVVADAMSDYLLHHNANTHWSYPTSAETDAMLLDAREVFAAFFGGDASEVSFGNNMTTITFHVARALGRDWKAGDEVIVTELDHHGNVAPWQAVAHERGIVLRWLPLDVATGQLRLDQLPGLINRRTRLVAIGAASNALGTVSDVRDVARMAHEGGALVYLDAVHYAPHFLPDVAALGCDLLACSAYKFYGPHVGVLWGRRALLDQLDLPRLAPAPNTAPESLETGTQNHEGIIGAAAAVRWLASLTPGGRAMRERLDATYRTLHQRQQSLVERLWQGLAAADGVALYGPPPEMRRTATVSFTMRTMPSQAAATALAARGSFVSHGDFYATTVVERLGLTASGLIRVGAACYTTEAEIDRLLEDVARLSR